MRPMNGESGVGLLPPITLPEVSPAPSGPPPNWTLTSTPPRYSRPVEPSYVHATCVHRPVTIAPAAEARLTLTEQLRLPSGCTKKPYWLLLSKMPMRVVLMSVGWSHASIEIDGDVSEALSATV